jgi:hypothetical protein
MALSRFGAVLVLDGGKGVLGEVALQLVRLGISTLYSNDLDEAALLARQEGRRVRGALAPSSTSPAQIDELLDAIAPHTSVRPGSLALVGPRPSDDDVATLLVRGLRWCLWDPSDAARLRLLASLVLWEGSEEDLRIDPRVPTALRSTLTVAGRGHAGQVRDLTTHGAFVEIASPPDPGRRLGIEIALPTGPIQLVASVCWTRAKPEAGPPPRPVGCGVAFTQPTPIEQKLLHAFVGRHLMSLQLE